MGDNLQFSRKRQCVKRSRRGEHAANDQASELILPPIYRLIQKQHGKNDLKGVPNPSLQMAYLDHIQRTAGNAAVQIVAAGVF